MAPPRLPFGARFLIFVGVVLGVVFVAAALLVLLGLLGISQVVLTPALALALIVSLGLVIGVLIVIAFTNPLIAAAAAAPIVFLALAALLIALLAAGVLSSGLALILFSILGLTALFLFTLWFLFGVHRIPLRLVGLGALTSMPAVPFRVAELIDTIIRLYGRNQEIQPAKEALLTTFTLGDGTPTAKTATGYEFMFADSETRQLDEPAQYAMGWTTLDAIDQRAAPLVDVWTTSLTDPDQASAQFWPTIARFSVPFSIVPLELVAEPRATTFRTLLGTAWTPLMQQLLDESRLFAIDMGVFSTIPAPTTANPRFTPATLTFLEFDATQKTFTPFMVRVGNGITTVVYDNSDPMAPCPAWLYALQAAKVSITVWGIWLGHVYRYHMIAAPMLMTSEQTMPASHPIRQLIAHQADFVIGFDQFLLIDWAIGPPTSIADPDAFLRLTNTFATGRAFFADDPPALLAAQGLTAPAFTSTTPFDRYPAARYLLAIFGLSTAYATAVVAAVYPGNAAVAADAQLQAWLAASRNPAGGNVSGLPPVTTTAALTGVLASLIFRITAHGIARMAPVANPALTWISNYPPCLEDSRIPAASTVMTTRELLSFMPKTRSMGEMLSFLLTFGYSPPYIPFVPPGGVGAALPFRGPAAAACNAALVAFRSGVAAFMTTYLADSNVQTAPATMGFQLTPAQLEQWPLNIEL